MTGQQMFRPEEPRSRDELLGLPMDVLHQIRLPIPMTLRSIDRTFIRGIVHTHYAGTMKGEQVYRTFVLVVVAFNFQSTVTTVGRRCRTRPAAQAKEKDKEPTLATSNGAYRLTGCDETRGGSILEDGGKYVTLESVPDGAGIMEKCLVRCAWVAPLDTRGGTGWIFICGIGERAVCLYLREIKLFS